MFNLLLFNSDTCNENNPIHLDLLNKYNDDQNISVFRNSGFVYFPYRRTSREIAGAGSNTLFQTL